MMAPGLANERRSGGNALDMLFRALVVIGVFAIVGPPVGGLVAWLAMGAWSLQSPIPFLVESYREALPIAAGTGLIVAVAGLIFGKTGWLVPLVAALLANLLFHGVLLVTSTATPIDGVMLLRLVEVFLPPSLVAALVCWLSTRHILTCAGTIA